MGKQIVNQVEDLYNGLGQLAFQYQSVSGAVDVSATPVVQYIYSSPSNGSRLTSMVYPNGRLPLILGARPHWGIGQRTDLDTDYGVGQSVRA